MYMHFLKKLFGIKIPGPLTNKIKDHSVNSSFAPSIPTVSHRIKLRVFPFYKNYRILGQLASGRSLALNES